VCGGEGKEVFFFERKNQEIFILKGSTRPGWSKPREQKFFASFFQKRRLFLFSQLRAAMQPSACERVT